jgi:hypothetical protein
MSYGASGKRRTNFQGLSRVNGAGRRPVYRGAVREYMAQMSHEPKVPVGTNIRSGGRKARHVVNPRPVFVPEIVELSDVWPACRVSHCGSRLALARVDAPYGPVAVLCENGHLRAYRKKDEFRGRGRYAGAFSALAVPPSAARNSPVRRLDADVRRRAEVLEDAERCAMCGTPPAEHPYRPDLAVRGDRDVWTWLQRWRPALYAELVEAIAILKQREPVTFGTWRLKISAQLRERIVRELDDSALETDQLVPPAVLARFVSALAPRELDFAVNALLLAICRRCNSGRWRARKSRDDYLREYVFALHGGNERLARADDARWRMMESLAQHAARVRLSADERSA